LNIYLENAELLDTPYERMQAVLAKWRTIVSTLEDGDTVENYGASSCAFCRFYYDTDKDDACEDCPINDDTHYGCMNTPYVAFEENIDADNLDNALESAKEMLEYLETLAAKLDLNKKIPKEPFKLPNITETTNPLGDSIKKWETVVETPEQLLAEELKEMSIYGANVTVESGGVNLEISEINSQSLQDVLQLVKEYSATVYINTNTTSNLPIKIRIYNVNAKQIAIPEKVEQPVTFTCVAHPEQQVTVNNTALYKLLCFHNHEITVKTQQTDSFINNTK